MLAVLAHIRPLDPATNRRVDIFVSSSPGAAYNGLGGIAWEPAIVRRPKGSLDLMSLDLSKGTKTATGDLILSLPAIKSVDASKLFWAGAEIQIYRVDDLIWPVAAELAGIVKTPQRDLDTDKLTLNIAANTAAIDRVLLTNQFTGDNAGGGDADKHGTFMPIGFGACQNIEVYWFDTTRNIGMIDGYGNTLAISWLGEGLSSYGPAVADYPSYAALAAAIDAKVVKPGQWATSIAAGLIGLGAPATGVVTCHAQFRYGTTGALMQHLLLAHAGIAAAQIDASAFAALDVAVPYTIHFWTAEQQTIRDLLESLATACNATFLVTFQNTFSVTRVFGGSIAATFTRGGFNQPVVTGWKANDVLDPFWQYRVRAARPVRVMTTDEVLYADTIINRGLYSATESYRQGNTVWAADGSQWLYINVTASVGNAPPTTGVANTYWRQLKPQTNDQIAVAYAAAVPVVKTITSPSGATVPFPYKSGDVVVDQNARWTYSTGLAWDGVTMPPTLPAQSNAYWTLLKDAAVATIAANITTVTIIANASGVPNDGQLPAVGRAIFRVGNSDVSSTVPWTIATSGCDATIAADGSWSITAVRVSGYIDLQTVYASTNYTVRVTTTLQPPTSSGSGSGSGSGGSGGSSANITSFPSVASGTYPSAPSTTAVVAAGANGLTFAATLNYSAAAASGGQGKTTFTLIAKIVYRVSGSTGGWTDAATETTGSQAYQNGYPDYVSADGKLTIASFAVSGLTAGTSYEFGVLLRETGTAGASTPDGNVSGATKS